MDLYFNPYRTENSMFSTNDSWEIGDSYLISKLIITTYSRGEILNEVHYTGAFIYAVNRKYTKVA